MYMYDTIVYDILFIYLLLLFYVLCFDGRDYESMDIRVDMNLNQYRIYNIQY